MNDEHSTVDGIHAQRRAMLAGLGGLAAGSLLARGASAGPLNPPPGPVSSTPGPEPRTPVSVATTPGDSNSTFRITQPGSYYLTSDLQGEASKHGIEIASDNVSLDLMGFALRGAPTSLDGIIADGNFASVSVRNGTVTGWVDGIDLAPTFAGSAQVVEDVRAVSNRATGIRVGNNSRITRCMVDESAQTGIRAGAGAIIEHCVVSSSGATGINTGDAARVESCVARMNTLIGVSVGATSVVMNCAAIMNGSSGFRLFQRGQIIDCAASSNSVGISFDGFCRVVGCHASDNATNGIATFAFGSTVEGNTAVSNLQNGILVALRCSVRGNTCDGNGSQSGSGAGIRLTGSDNVVASNTCTGNRQGIEAITGGNFITRNTCSGNTTNYVIAAGNSCLVVQAATSGAINGSVGGVAPGSTDPNENFSF